VPCSDIEWGEKTFHEVFDIIGRRENKIAPVTITSKSNLSFILQVFYYTSIDKFLLSNSFHESIYMSFQVKEIKFCQVE
jgi:hypothetical protein